MEATTYEGIEIRETILGDALFGDADTSEYDVEASVRRYCDLVREYAAKELPGVEIDFAVDLSAVDYSRPLSVHGTDDRQVEEYVEGAYSEITQRIWSWNEWVVLKGENA